MLKRGGGNHTVVQIYICPCYGYGRLVFLCPHNERLHLRVPSVVYAANVGPEVGLFSSTRFREMNAGGDQLGSRGCFYVYLTAFVANGSGQAAKNHRKNLIISIVVLCSSTYVLLGFVRLG